MVDCQCSQNPSASTVKNPMSDLIVSTCLFLETLHHTRNLYHPPCHLPTTTVTQYRCADNVKPDDILNYFDISYHIVCIVFNNTRNLLDPFSITAYHSLTISVYHTLLHLQHLFRIPFTLPWPSASMYSRVVDDGFPVSTKHRCVDSEKAHVKFNTFDRFSPLNFAWHRVTYIIHHILYRQRVLHNTGEPTM